MSEGRIAIIGPEKLVGIFSMFGVETHPVSDAKEAYDVFVKVQNQYSLIVVLESVADKILQDVKENPPLVLPDTFSHEKKSEKALRKLFEKILGVDLLAEGEGYYGR
ncbi:V-type ATP synthase subunit F [Thermotoga caldifontis]|uniref:V-type ATP synthase subunit F n=1 Tax=Thermotoga caldifontis TaxID=1508419 RepID=UPI0005972793|nr:V-type ATP synthase subunit F [Thermotoga caldifontis]